MNTQPQKLWDPKQAVVGVLTIAVAVLVLDVLPGLIVKRIKGFGDPPPVPEPQSIKSSGYEKTTLPIAPANPYGSSAHYPSS